MARPRIYDDERKYAAQRRWGEKNAKKYGVMLTKNADQDLIDFLESAKEYVPPSALFRYGASLAKLFTEGFSVLTKYTADNGDEFIRIRTFFNTETAKKTKPIKCRAEYRESPVPHISYYTKSGDFIATAGTHVHDRLGAMTEFLYTKRVSKKVKNDVVTEVLGYQD